MQTRGIGNENNSNNRTGGRRLTYHVLAILAPQMVLLVTVALLGLTSKVRTGGSQSVSAMICFTGMVVAALVQLRLYVPVFAAGRVTTLPAWMVLDPMAWILTVAIFLIATVAVLTRRLRNSTGHGDLRFCLLITISTLGWSIMPALHSLPLIAASMLLGSLPLAWLSTFGYRNNWLITLMLLTALAVMLLALGSLVAGGLGVRHANALIHLANAPPVWTGILMVLFMMPILFWIGSLPLVWWYGEVAGNTPAPGAFFMLLAPGVASLGTYLRIIHSLTDNNPVAAGIVISVMIAAGILALAAYGIRAVFQTVVPDILGNIVGILAACTFVTLTVGMSAVQPNAAQAVACVLLYALTAGIAMGSAAGIFGRQTLGLNQQWPVFARMKKLHALMLVLALLSLGGLPPTLGSLARMQCLQTVGLVSVPGMLVLIANTLAILFGSGAAMRVAAYAIMGVPEVPNRPMEATTVKRRRPPRMATVTLLLLLTACMLNALALLAYYPIQQIATAFAPAWVSR